MPQAARSDQDPAIPLPLSEQDDPPRRHAVSLVLTAPRRFAELVAQDRFGWRSCLLLLGAAICFDAVYGIAMGMFSGGHALWMSGVKVPLIAVISLALCAPSLYVLLGLNGSPIRVRQAAAVLSGTACLTSLLLVGFAPVAWLFGVSTNNAQFMILLHVVVWSIGVGYGVRLLGQCVPRGFQGNKILVLWTFVFLIVGAQMMTYFRPLLALAADGAFRNETKQFFFEHFRESMWEDSPNRPPEHSQHGLARRPGS